MEGVFPIFLFDTIADLERADASSEQLRKKPENLIFCGSCNALVTADINKLQVKGAFEHQFINPVGIEFLIGCFSSAPGCDHHGQPSFQHSWFVGYSWNYAICRKCHWHLGWHYKGTGPGFYGLILDRLRFG